LRRWRDAAPRFRVVDAQLRREGNAKPPKPATTTNTTTTAES
jgi:hypothetical protein